MPFLTTRNAPKGHTRIERGYEEKAKQTNLLVHISGSVDQLPRERIFLGT